jgi:hypothetical protein
VTIGAQKSQVLRAIVKSIAVYMVDVQSNRFAVPIGTQSTLAAFFHNSRLFDQTIDRLSVKSRAVDQTGFDRELCVRDRNTGDNVTCLFCPTF